MNAPHFLLVLAARGVAELIGAKQGEVKPLPQGRLEASRAREADKALS